MAFWLVAEIGIIRYFRNAVWCVGQSINAQSDTK